MIRTNFETNGVWTTSEQGQQFMVDVAADTGVQLDSIGKSYLGRDLYRFTLGTGDRLAVITGGVHRFETASRELVLIKARDLAYNVDGRYSDYLATHKIMIIPTVSPDVTSRNNAQNLNINRDAYYLETPEMAALMSMIADEKPDVYVDFHERSGTLKRVEFIDPSSLDPNADPLVKNAAAAMDSYTRTTLNNAGYETATYPYTIIGPSKTVSAAALLGSASMTPETHIEAGDDWFRINGLGEVFEAILRWHSQNHALFDEIKARYADATIRPGEKFTLLNGSNEYYYPATKVPITTPTAYVVDDPAAFQKFADTYNIEMDADGRVPIEQQAGRLIPHLLDPKSDMKATTATRIEAPSRRSDGRYTKVFYDEWREVFIKNYGMQ